MKQYYIDAILDLIQTIDDPVYLNSIYDNVSETWCKYRAEIVRKGLAS